MIVQMFELAWDSFKDIKDMFRRQPDIIESIRRDYINDCYGAAEEVKKILNQNGYLAEIITFKNGSAFLNGIKVYGEVHTHHSIVLLGECLIDILYSDKILKTKEYIQELKKENPYLRIDYLLSTGWYDNEGYLYRPTLEELMEYRY